MTIIKIFGLIFNIIGALFLAFSFKATENVGTHENEKGKTTDFALVNFNKCRFNCGILFILIGFIIQLMYELFLNIHKYFY